MGQRRRQLREELERRENGVVSPSPLGPGGEARVAAAKREAKLDELKKAGEALREQRSRQQKAAWDSARASAKKRGESSGAMAADDDDLEERTVRAKWARKESHSDYTLDVLFSRFGTVESVSIEAGTGNKALVTFASPAAADAAVATYREHETMRASYVGKRRPKRAAFASRYESLSTPPPPPPPTPTQETSSFRDKESLVMMKLRQEAERQALIRKMAEEEGLPVGQRAGGCISSADVAASAHACESATNKDVLREGRDAYSVDITDSNSGASSRPVPTVGDGKEVEKQRETTPTAATPLMTSRKGITPSSGRNHSPPLVSTPLSAVGCGPSSTPASFRGRESDILSAMMKSPASSPPLSSASSSTMAASATSSPPFLATGGCNNSGGVSVDEGDILARMMKFNK